MFPPYYGKKTATERPEDRSYLVKDSRDELPSRGASGGDIIMLAVCISPYVCSTRPRRFG